MRFGRNIRLIFKNLFLHKPFREYLFARYREMRVGRVGTSESDKHKGASESDKHKDDAPPPLSDAGINHAVSRIAEQYPVS